MLAKLKAALAALSKSLGIQAALRDRAVSRMKARHAEQKGLERQKEAAASSSAWLRAEARKAFKFGSNLNQAKGERLWRKADRKHEKAQKLGAKAAKAEAKAVIWKGRARKLTNRIEGIETDLGKVNRELAKLGPKIDLKKQTCTGGTFAERWRASNLMSAKRYSEGKRAGRYSQAGTPDIHHPYGPGPGSGTRDDCSSYITSQALATGADDPNGCDFSGEGFTGTLAGAHGRWKQVSLEHMVKAGHGYIVYGSGDGHHSEAYCPVEGDVMATIGHGDEAVNRGTVHCFGSGEVERYFIYAGK